MVPIYAFDIANSASFFFTDRKHRDDAIVDEVRRHNGIPTRAPAEGEWDGSEGVNLYVFEGSIPEHECNFYADGTLTDETVEYCMSNLS